MIEWYREGRKAERIDTREVKYLSMVITTIFTVSHRLKLLSRCLGAVLQTMYGTHSVHHPMEKGAKLYRSS